MTIRTATLDDAPALRRYAELLFSENLPGIFRHELPTLEQEVDFLGTYLDAPNSTALIAEENGMVVGLVGFEGGKTAEEAHAGEIGVSSPATTGAVESAARSSSRFLSGRPRTVSAGWRYASGRTIRVR